MLRLSYSCDQEDLMSFLVRCANAPAKYSVMEQLALQIGSKLEEWILDIEKAGPPAPLEPRVRSVGVLEFGYSSGHDERALLSYIAAGKARSAGVRNLSSAVDKVRVFGKGLFDCFIVDSQNVGWWGPPKDSLSCWCLFYSSQPPGHNKTGQFQGL